MDGEGWIAHVAFAQRGGASVVICNSEKETGSRYEGHEIVNRRLLLYVVGLCEYSKSKTMI